MLPKDDVVRLQHMLDAAREAMAFAKGRPRAEGVRDRMLLLALVKCIEIIGEAASQVSEASRSQCMRIPWVDIVGMRNRLVHAYFDVDVDRVWDTIQDDLPPLVEALTACLALKPEA